MGGSVNKILIIGNVGKDPEVRSAASGFRVANLSVATSESWKDRSTGERKERSEWHKVVAMQDGLVGFIEQYVRKGNKIYVEGKITTRKWTDKDGNDRYSTEIVANAIQLLDSIKSNQESTEVQTQDDIDDEVPW